MRGDVFISSERTRGHASVAILIPIFYWLVGLCCLLSEFNQREIMVLGVVQLLIFLAFHAAQRLNGGATRCYFRSRVSSLSAYY